jgi:phosphoribosylformylglycinamidine synthase
VDSPALLKDFFNTIQTLNADGKLLAYHDRSDGGLVAALAEMAFAARVGLDIDLSALAATARQLAAVLFNEELGAVIQVRKTDVAHVQAAFAKRHWPMRCIS